MNAIDPRSWSFLTDAPVWLVVLFWVVFAVLAVTWTQTITVTIAAFRIRRGERRALPVSPQREDAADPYGRRVTDYLWVFLVPALNEAVTIADSVARLQAVGESPDARGRTARKVIVVIDDGSDDGTGEILAGLDAPDLRVLTRQLPEARRGKAAALNAAYEYVRTDLRQEEGFREFDADHVVVGIVDADGRLERYAPHQLVRYFADHSVGGAQVLVRIYNRETALTRAQDLEFGIFGHVIQAGRARWGTANMGGNGQFNRLSALISVDEGCGPWRDRLTEDQDLGVRLVQTGWCCVHDNNVAVHQQGVNNLRRLYRQRTRWAQGAWQALSLLPHAGAMHHRPWARLDAIIYLLMPILQVAVTADLVFSIAYPLMTGTSPIPAQIAVDVLLVGVMLTFFAPAFLVAAWRSAHGDRWRLVLSGLGYVFYVWLLMPTLLLALVRQLRGRTSWAKTEREPLSADADDSDTSVDPLSVGGGGEAVITD